ncbi:MAG: FAD-dependent oxidoreductase [Proteobacteria bacterium]|nr:FAD-dependent oxidoreductase [Pseudomonadota bacterium]
MKLTRREFARQIIPASLASAVILGTSSPVIAKRRKPKVLVMGGGVGGLIAAKNLAQLHPSVDVTLIEKSPTYVSNFNANLYIGGLITFDEISHTYDQLVASSPIKLIRQRAAAIDRKKKQVSLASGEALAYDRLVLSPGVDLRYDSIPGWGAEFEDLMPHAWKGGRQIALLKLRLDAVEDGGTIVVLAPPNPYACPPGPYERVSMMAHALRAAGKRNCKIIVLDPKESFSMQGLFEEGWESHYPGMIQWIDASIYETIQSVDPKTNTVVTGFDTYRNAALVNVIPAQVAAAIARDAGLVDETGYCPIEAATMRSMIDPDIYALGDACLGGDMPKSAYAASSQAKVAAAAIATDLLGKPPASNSYESVCWSEIERDDAVKYASRYELRDAEIRLAASTVSQMGETAELRKANQQEKFRWNQTLVADMFS